MFDFMETEVEVSNLKYLENYKSDRYLFRILNSKRINACSANGILRDTDGIAYAIKCNCGHYTYHPVFNGKIVDWSPDISIKEKNKNLVQKKIKELWIKEL
jgi:hypothetical protein